MISIRFEGGAELAAELARLSTRLSKRLLRDALTEGAEPMRISAGSHAARRSPAPDIADNIVVSTANTDDQAAIAMGPARRFYYGLFLENGTVKMGARPFLRPGFDGNVGRSLGIISAALWRELAGRGVNRPTAISEAAISAPAGGDLL